MWGTVGVKGSVLEKMKAVKAAGFDGAEMNSQMDVEEVLRARDEAGLEIPSVCCSHHWAKPLTHPDPAVRAESVEATKQALREAKRYGATSILLVPGDGEQGDQLRGGLHALPGRVAQDHSDWPRNSGSRSPSKTFGTNSCSARWKPPVTWMKWAARWWAGISTPATS